MLRQVKVRGRSLRPYDALATSNVLADLRRLARRLEGKRLLHLNSAADGGGVAEILRSEVPLLQGLGIRAEWHVIDADPAFYDVTKKIHNALQGAPAAPTPAEWRTFDDVNRDVARDIRRDWDYVFVHDPQPSGVRQHRPRSGDGRWVWRCHIDSGEPNRRVAARLRGALAHYDGLVFSRRAYAIRLDGLPVGVVRPAIDPLAPKNAPIPAREARRRVAGFGLDPDQPIVLQVSRFDPWKDQTGTIAAWKLARRHVPRLQLALVGGSAEDDPGSASVLQQVRRALRGTSGAFVLHNCVDDRGVKAFLSQAGVVVQKSLREGFGLTVSEALWSGRPVIGGTAGGIPLQVRDGREGFLVRTPREAARRMVELLTKPDLARRLGRAGRERVRRHFLLPRLMRDDLRFLLSLRGR